MQTNFDQLLQHCMLCTPLYYQVNSCATRCCQAKACHPTPPARTRQRPVRQAVVVRLRARAEAARMAWTNASVSSVRGAGSAGLLVSKTDQIQRTREEQLAPVPLLPCGEQEPVRHCPRYALQRRRTCPPIALCAASKARLGHCDCHRVTGDRSFPCHVACVDQKS